MLKEKSIDNQNYQGNSGAYSDDASSIGFAFLGFLIPIVGLILYIVWKNDYPLRAASAGKGALISVIMGVVASLVFILITSCAICALY